MTDAALDDPDALLAREAALRARAGSLRMRDAAAALGVPEAALLEVRRQGGEAIRLARPDAPEGFGRLLARLPEAGTVMALTRNESAVHEKVGRFAAPGDRGRARPGGRRHRPAPVPATLALRLRVTEGGAAQHPVLRRRRHRRAQGLPRAATDAAAFDAIVAASPIPPPPRPLRPPRRRSPSAPTPRSTSPACAPPGARCDRPTCSSG